MLGDPPVRKTIPKSQRIGVYRDVFERVLAYKEAEDAKRSHEEWTANMDSAVKAREQYGAKTDLMDWDAYIEGLGPEPPAPEAAVFEAVAERQSAKAATARAEAATAVAVEDRQWVKENEKAQAEEERILAAMRKYDRPR